MRKSALLIALFMSATFMTGFNMNAKINKLEEDEYAHFMALRVYMDPPNAKGERRKDERKEYLKLKTRAERDQWLKDKGLWDKFYQYPPHIRQKIADGAVQIGWDKHMVYMSWGRPSSVSEWRGVRPTALALHPLLRGPKGRCPPDLGPKYKDTYAAQKLYTSARDHH